MRYFYDIQIWMKTEKQRYGTTTITITTTTTTTTRE